MNERLYRNPSKATLGGVCAGLAERFGIETVIIQLIFFFGTVLSHGFFFWMYIILWIALPVKNTWDTTVNDTTSFNFNKPDMKKESNKIWGAVLIGLGLIFFLDEWIPSFDMHKLWPLVLIGVGGYIIFKDKKSNNGDNNTQF